MCAGALLAICVAAKDVWLVRRDWNALGVSGTKHTVDDMEQCYHTANEGGHKQWSFAQDSHHCYISDNMHWGGSALKGVTSGCSINGPTPRGCGTAGGPWWTIQGAWDSLGISGTRKDASDLAACLAMANGHAMFSYNLHSGHCYFSDKKKDF